MLSKLARDNSMSIYRGSPETKSSRCIRAKKLQYSQYLYFSLPHIFIAPAFIRLTEKKKTEKNKYEWTNCSQCIWLAKATCDWGRTGWKQKEKKRKKIDTSIWLNNCRMIEERPVSRLNKGQMSWIYGGCNMIERDSKCTTAPWGPVTLCWWNNTTGSHLITLSDPQFLLHCRDGLLDFLYDINCMHYIDFNLYFFFRSRNSRHHFE